MRSLNLNQHVRDLLEKCHNLTHLKQLQAFLITIGHSETQFYTFKLVRFCNLVLSDLHYARFIFDHLHSPNVHLYTAMITSYASQPDHQSAILLYRRMVRQGSPQPNQFIYPHVLKCCPELESNLECDNLTELVHTQIIKSGFGSYPVVQTALVDTYSRSCSNIGTARKMFDEMSDRNVVTWTAMVSGYTRLGEIGNAVTLFERMPERDIPAWNAVIAGFTQNGFFSEAIIFFRRMTILALEGGQDHGNWPNLVTTVCALSACGHTGMLKLGKWIHGYVYKHGYSGSTLSSFISNALVDMYGKCGNLKIARQVFDMAKDKSLTSWNSMINCFALHGQSENAINVFEEMIRSRNSSTTIRPDGVTFVGLLNACTHGGLVEKGCIYFDLMKRTFGIEPQIEHYGCLIDLLGRAGRFEEAIGTINGMSIEPDEVVWGSLLNGCRIYGRMDLAEFSVKKLIEIDPKNGGYLSMLANIYVEMGKWDEVRKVRRVLKEESGSKTPGCSWVEVDHQAYRFYSHDQTHPRTEEIYKMLESLIG